MKRLILFDTRDGTVEAAVAAEMEMASKMKTAGRHNTISKIEAMQAAMTTRIMV